MSGPRERLRVAVRYYFQHALERGATVALARHCEVAQWSPGGEQERKQHEVARKWSR